MIFLNSHASPYLPLDFWHKKHNVLKALFGAREEDRFFPVFGVDEAVFSVFISHYLDFVRETGRSHILFPEGEGMSIVRGGKRLEKLGCACKTLPLNAQGQLTARALEEALRPRTSLVALSWVNGLTGVIHRLLDIAEVCKAHGVRLYVDATYAIGKLSFRFQDLGSDFLSFHGTPLYLPSGIGGLFVRSDTSFTPSSPLEQSVSLLPTLSDRLFEFMHYFEHFSTETARLRHLLEMGIKNAYPEAELLFQEVERSPSSAVIAFPGIAAEALLFSLQRKGLYASRGGGSFPLLSHHLLTIGLQPELSHTAISFSLSHQTTEEEIVRAIDLITQTAKRMRTLSKGII